MWDLICLDWNGGALSPEQKLVVRNVAAKHLRTKKKHATIHFSHPLCGGIITRKDGGSFGTFSGTFFHADLGIEGGEPQTIDFLIPRNSEWMMIEDDSLVLSAKPIPGDLGVRRVDPKKARIV